MMKDYFFEGKQSGFYFEGVIFDFNYPPLNSTIVETHPVHHPSPPPMFVKIKKLQSGLKIKLIIMYRSNQQNEQ